MLQIMKKTVITAALALAASLTALSGATAEDRVRTDNVSDHQLALKGYDPVAYFDTGEPTAGKSRFSYTYKGVLYRFASATNREKFAAMPAKYEPQYGGFCAFGASVGLKLEVDPEAFDIIDGKLYLNNSFDIHNMWLENTDGRIKAGDRHWRRIRGVAASKLDALPFDDE